MVGFIYIGVQISYPLCFHSSEFNQIASLNWRYATFSLIFAHFHSIKYYI